MTSGRGLIPTTEEVLQNAGAFGAHLGFGSIAWYAAGKAMRAGTNIGLVLAGAGFITAQMLQQRGYIQVDWNKVENEVRAVLDVDGDGELTTTDASIAWDGIVDSLRVGVPGSAGFAAGALAGFGGGGVAKLVAVSGVVAATALTAAETYAKSDEFREYLATQYPLIAETLARQIGERVDAVRDGDAAFRLALRMRRDLNAIDDLRSRVRRNDAGHERAVVKERLKLVDERRRVVNAEAKASALRR